MLSTSIFSVAMRINPYMSCQALFREMTGKAKPKEINEAMQWGVDHEVNAVAATEAFLGDLFLGTGDRQIQLYREDAGRKFRTTPDGHLSGTGLECKCPQKMYEDVPAHYMAQVQGQCWIAPFKQVYFTAWTPSETRIWLVPRSDEYIDFMVPLLHEFLDSVDANEVPKRRKKPVPPQVDYERLK